VRHAVAGEHAARSENAAIKQASKASLPAGRPAPEEVIGLQQVASKGDNWRSRGPWAR